MKHIPGPLLAIVVAVAPLLLWSCAGTDNASRGADGATLTKSSGPASTETSGTASSPPSSPFHWYPVSVETQAVMHSGGNKVAGTGWQVDYPDDSRDLLISSPYMHLKKEAGAPPNSSVGSVWLIRRGRKMPLATFLEPGAVNHLFGAAAAISGDESLVVIGAPGYRYPDTGQVYFYPLSPNRRARHKSGYHLQKAAFRFDGNPGAYFGYSVAVDQNGSTVVIGAPGNHGEGSVWVFSVPNGNWAGLKRRGGRPRELRLPGPLATNAFGTSVAVSGDGSEIVVGDPANNLNVADLGAVYIYRRDGNRWKLLTTDSTRAPDDDFSEGLGYFGSSVAVNYDGSQVVVGAPGDGYAPVEEYTVGSVWGTSVDESGRLWWKQLPEPPGAYAVGFSVDISPAGDIVAAGSLGTNNDGEVTVYGRAKGSDWWHAKIIFNEDCSSADILHEHNMLCGASVSLSSDGHKLAFGVPGYAKGRGLRQTIDLTRVLRR